MAIIIVVLVTVLIDFVSGAIRRRIIEGAGARRLHGEELEEPDFAASGAGRVDSDAG
jgi:hypothetical protein